MYRFVFEARIKPGCTEEQYIDAWRAGSAIIQQEPGAMGTRLHRFSPNHFVAMATWKSKAARDAATLHLGLADQNAVETESVLHRHMQFADITPLFGLEEITAIDPEMQPKAPFREMLTSSEFPPEETDPAIVCAYFLRRVLNWHLPGGTISSQVLPRWLAEASEIALRELLIWNTPLREVMSPEEFKQYLPPDQTW